MLRSRPIRSLTLATLVTACMLIGCAPTPAPTPSPTPAFASDEEAFAAAEKTYRAYIDALNAVDLADPETFEPVFERLSDSALSATKKSFSELHAGRVVMNGETRFDSFRGVSYETEVERIASSVCLDVSGVQLTDASGTSLVATDRPDRQPMRIEWRMGDERDNLLIASMSATEGLKCEP